jgi:hypothetical protein
MRKTVGRSSVLSCGVLTSEQRKLKKWSTRKSETRQSRQKRHTRGPVRNGASLRRPLLWAVVIDCNCNRSANKSNHSIHNPLLLDTEPLIRDNIYYIAIVCLLCEDVRDMFRPFLGHHQASYQRKFLNCVVLIWIHILQSLLLLLLLTFFIVLVLQLAPIGNVFRPKNN